MASPSEIEVARRAAAVIGGTAQVHEYWNDGDRNRIAILSVQDQPAKGWATYSTVGLHRAPNILDDRDVRVEMIGMAAGAVEAFPNVIASAAFFVIKNHWLCAPGVIFPDVLDGYEVSKTLRHLVWATPFPWPALNGFSTSSGLDVHWLLAIPISDSERALIVENGFDRFEDLMERRDVPYFDLERIPIV
jgi:hypothetical protein